MTIVGTINVLGKEIVVRVSETKIDDFGIKTIKTSGTSSIVKQVLNHFREEGLIKFDKVWVSSEEFSGGSGLRVHTLGSDEISIGKIKSICEVFTSGSFNIEKGFYEWRNDELVLFPLDTEEYPHNIKIGTKFVSYKNRPPYGTSEYFQTEVQQSSVLETPKYRLVA